MEAVKRYVEALLRLGRATPMFVFLSLIGATGYRIWRNRGTLRGRDHTLDRPALLVPEVVIEDPGFNAGVVLKPAFDVIWNAFNWPRGTENLNDAGEWVGSQQR